ncbi:MAG TPA: alpha/beta hydrolase [Vicinamibacterales bacterium]
MNPEYTTVDGVRIRFRIHRNPGAPKLLLINSLPQSIRCWDAHWNDLSRSYELLAMDMPGFGLSDCRPDMLSPSAEAEILGKIIVQFSWQRCIAIGPDIGVPVVLSLAQNQPDLVSGIVIFDGPGYYEPVFSVDLRWTMKYRWFRWLGAKTYKPEVYLKGVFARGYKKFTPPPDVYEEYVAVNSDRGAFERTTAFLATYPKELTVIGDALGKITLPVLIVWGEEDVFVPVENARELARRIPRNKLHIFKGCGHFSHEDAGDEFTEVLRSWVASEIPAPPVARPS